MPLGLQWTLPLTRGEALDQPPLSWGLGFLTCLVGVDPRAICGQEEPLCLARGGHYICSVGAGKGSLLKFCRQDRAATRICFCRFVP